MGSPEKILDELLKEFVPQMWVRMGDIYEAALKVLSHVLLNTLGKAMESVIAKRISYTMETLNLLPFTHMGGRKQTLTENAVQLIVEKTHAAWNKPIEEVVTLLLLDVAGAFDHVSHVRLLHNLRKRGISEKTVAWISSFLQNRTTRLSMDTHRDHY